jgi:hypothetical protein
MVRCPQQELKETPERYPLSHGEPMNENEKRQQSRHTPMEDSMSRSLLAHRFIGFAFL